MKRTKFLAAFLIVLMLLSLITVIVYDVLAAEDTELALVIEYLPIIINQITSTPTPTPTPTPSPTPTLTPTVIPQVVQILPNHSFFIDSSDYLNIVGEVLNNTRSNISLVQVAVNIFNSNGQLLDTDSTYIYLNNLPAREKTCFLISMPKPVGWSYYEFESPTYLTDSSPLPNLTVFNVSGSYNPLYEEYQIIGQVRNDHNSRVEYVSPVGTIYNASGVVIGCDFTYVNSTHLDPGQTSSFKLSFWGRNYSDVATYRVQVDGYPR